MCSEWVVGGCVTRAQGWARGAFVLGDGSKIGLFDYFFSHLLTNPVRYLGVSLQNGIL